MSKSPSLRRIQADVRELALDPSERYYAAPLENDMFEWHFTIRGAEETDFEGGVYHGRILLPPEYPFKPPHIVFLTPSGRFETNTKVCLSFSAFHPELWQPAWGIRLILEALISFLPTPADGAIGALDWSSKERKRLAQASQRFCCPKCCGVGQVVKDLLPTAEAVAKRRKGQETKQSLRFAKEIEELQRLQRITEGETQDEENKEDGGKVEDASKQEDESNEATTNDESSSPADSKETPAPKEEDQEGASGSVTTTATTPPPGETEENASTSKQEATLETTPLLVDETLPTDKATAATTTTTTNTPRGATTVGVGDEPHTEPTPAPADDVVVMEEEATNNNANVQQWTDPSWMYDPLLNLMLILLAVICYLLLQKLQDLMAELNEMDEL